MPFIRVSGSQMDRRRQDTLNYQEVPVAVTGKIPLFEELKPLGGSTQEQKVCERLVSGKGRYVVTNQTKLARDDAERTRYMMQLAGHLGIGPRSTPAEQRDMMVSDKIPGRWLKESVLTEDRCVQSLARAFRKLHGYPNADLPKGLVINLEQKALERLGALRSSGQIPEAVLQDIEQRLIHSPFENQPRHLIHGDPWAGNIIVSPDKRVHLIDWDNAGLSYRSYDLARLSLCCFGPDTEWLFLQKYMGGFQRSNLYQDILRAKPYAAAMLATSWLHEALDLPRGAQENFWNPKTLSPMTAARGCHSRPEQEFLRYRRAFDSGELGFGREARQGFALSVLKGYPRAPA